jgi:hypothetical protein
MSEEKEVRATHQEVEEFVGKLRGFHDSLDPAGQAMLETIVQSAQSQDTGAYFLKRGFSSQGGSWEDLVGWMESQGQEDTQGFSIRRSF